MIEVVELNSENITDFLTLLEVRGKLDYQFNAVKYSNQNFYTGFIAYIDKKPAGCIGITKRSFSYNGKENKIAWFNDWFVDQNFRGFNVGVLLIKTVGEYYGFSCGIITPQKSGLIAPKAGFVRSIPIFECRFPINAFKVGYNKYCINKKHTDPFYKRIIRSLLFKIRSSSRIDKSPVLPILEYKSEYVSGLMHSAQHSDSFLLFDQSYLLYIIDTLQKFSEVKREFWVVKNENHTMIGFYQELPTGITQAVLLYASNVTKANIHQVYSQLFRSIISHGKADQINVLLDKESLVAFSLSAYFYKELPFFTYNFEYISESLFYHIDKESSWSDFLPDKNM